MSAVRQREPRIEIPKLRKSAHGKPCTMRTPYCNGNPETTVWAHSDFHEHGKGVGTKAHDIFGAYLCSACHDWLDVLSRQQGIPNDVRRDWFRKAFERSLLIILTERILK